MRATTTPPLADYRIVGVITRHYQAAPEAPKQPGGSCWHCGQAIAVCVQARHDVTGDVVEVGTTCAERCGLNAAALKAMLADKFAAERAERSAATAAARRAERDRLEAEATAANGPHGTETRYVSGCRCDDCRAVAPHGTLHRFYEGCDCLACQDAAIEDGSHEVRDYPVLVDLATGEPADARLVDTRYGMKWCVDDGNAWISPHPKRRSTMTAKGYVEATVPYLVRINSRRSQWLWTPVRPVACALVDDWGEQIERLS